MQQTFYFLRAGTFAIHGVFILDTLQQIETLLSPVDGLMTAEVQGEATTM